MTFAETAARLSGLVPRLMGWAPETFWNATPAELAAILAPQTGGEPTPLTRGEFDSMLERERNG